VDLVHPGSDHSAIESLGSAGIVEFYLCRGCHDGIVAEGSRRWAVAAATDTD
jgi:hypothetical protein